MVNHLASDPVNSYLSNPILIGSKNDIETTSIPTDKKWK